VYFVQNIPFIGMVYELTDSMPVALEEFVCPSASQEMAIDVMALDHQEQGVDVAHSEEQVHSHAGELAHCLKR
jgi:hypothetical protein